MVSFPGPFFRPEERMYRVEGRKNKKERKKKRNEARKKNWNGSTKKSQIFGLCACAKEKYCIFLHENLIKILLQCEKGLTEQLSTTAGP